MDQENPPQVIPAVEATDTGYALVDHFFYIESLEETANLLDWLDLPEDPEYLAKLFAALRTQINNLKTIQDDVGQALLKLMDSRKPLPIEGVGVFEKKWSSGRDEWDHSGIAHALAKVTLASETEDDKNGPDQLWRASDLLVETLLRVAGVTYWRTGEARKLGVNPDEFRERGDGKYAVKFVASNPQPPAP